METRLDQKSTKKPTFYFATICAVSNELHATWELSAYLGASSMKLSREFNFMGFRFFAFRDNKFLQLFITDSSLGPEETKTLFFSLAIDELGKGACKVHGATYGIYDYPVSGNHQAHRTGIQWKNWLQRQGGVVQGAKNASKNYWAVTTHVKWSDLNWGAVRHQGVSAKPQATSHCLSHAGNQRPAMSHS